MSDDQLVPARINVPLLRKTMEHIEQHPEEWDQSFWMSECGTKACFAGWACVFSGVEVVYSWARCTTADGDSAGAAAQDALGLTFEDADQLFEANNTMAELRSQVDRLIALGEASDG